MPNSNHASARYVVQGRVWIPSARRLNFAEFCHNSSGSSTAQCRWDAQMLGGRPNIETAGESSEGPAPRALASRQESCFDHGMACHETLKSQPLNLSVGKGKFAKTCSIECIPYSSRLECDGGPKLSSSKLRLTGDMRCGYRIDQKYVWALVEKGGPTPW